jgi:hypothetical protein
MAQTALTLVGYAVGSYFGGALGGQFGAAIGAYVGGVIAAPDQEGPRITDTTVQQSSYGTGIAKTYGTDRIAPTLIWAGPMVEHSDSQSGKGGPTVTTFSYTRSFALLIGDGPIGGIRRIWADTKLVFDLRDVADDEAQLASALLQSYFVLYLGTEDQMPDPTIESIEGAGNVEAYRGRAYIVFTDLPLADYGNRIPQFSVEVTPEDPVASDEIAYEPLVIYPWILLGQFPSHSVGDTAWRNHVPAGGSTTYTNFGDAVEATRLAGAASGDFWSPSAFYSDTYVDIYTDSANAIYNREGGANAVADDAQYVWLRTAAEPPASFRTQLPDPSVGDDWLVLTEQVKTWVNYGVLHSGEVIAYRHLPYSAFGSAPGAISPAYQTSYASGSLGGSTNYLVRGNPVLQVQGERVPTHASRSCLPGDPCESPDGQAEMPGNSDWCISCTGEISPNYDWTIVAGTAKQLCAIEYRDGTLYQQARGPVLLPSDPNYSNSAYWNAQFAAAVAAGEVHADVTHPVVVSSYAQRGPFTASQLDAGAADLADIVLDICLEAGLEADQVDVTDLEGHEVLGYTRARRTSARSVLEPLRAAFFFDAVESGDQIRFVRRGGAPVATLTIDDLAAGAEAANAEEPVLSDRGQEAELPRVVSVAYKSADADYQTGTQEDRRRVGGTEQQNGSELPIVLTDTQAKQIAQKLLYDSWVERNKRTLSTWRKWSALEPTDVVLVDDGSFTYRLRITEKSEQQGVITLQAHDDDAAAYTSVAVGAPVAGGGKEVRVDGPTRYELLDIPLLRQADDSASPYVAARGYRSDWRGGRLYRSTDGGISYGVFQDLGRTAIIGHAQTVLGDYGGGNTIDEINSVTVTLIGGGTLASITLAQLLDNGNPAVLGAEVFQYKRAVLVAERTYTLTGLLRGRLGTEQHIGTHEAGDAFAVLDADTLYRPAFELSRVGLELLYKAVSFGLPDTADGEPFTNTGVALKPLSPVHLNVAPAPGGGYAATWVRRSRYVSPWQDSVDVPLGEADERYLVRVLDGDTEVETHTVTEPSVTLGVAEGAGPTLTAAVTFEGEAFTMAAVDSPGDIVGVARNAGVSLYHYTARKWDGSSGAILQESADLGEVVQSVHGNDELYAVGGTYSGALYNAVTLYRFAYSDLTTPAATRACTDPAVLGWQGVAFDGADLWAIAQDLHELQRCNPTTLARVNGYSFTPDQAFRLWAAGGWLWMQLITVGNTRLVRIDPADGSTVDSLPLVTFGGVYALSESRVFVIQTGGVRQYDATASPPALISSFTRASPALELTTGAVVGTLLYVGEAGVDVIAGVHVFDMVTGVYLGNTTNASAAMPAGGRGDQLLAASAASGNQSFAFDVGALATTDLGGLTLEVSQLSATIGAGFPATVTIPEAP